MDHKYNRPLCNHPLCDNNSKLAMVDRVSIPIVQSHCMLHMHTTIPVKDNCVNLIISKNV